jgi:hypothetical protein
MTVSANSLVANPGLLKEQDSKALLIRPTSEPLNLIRQRSELICLR